jgi:hypothetical protein
MTILSGSSSIGTIAFGDSGSGTISSINYDHSTNHLNFHTNGLEAIRIDSSGNLLVARSNALPHTTNSGTSADNGHALTKTGYVAFSRFCSSTSDNLLLLNRTSTDGNLISLRKDGTEVGNIFSRGGAVSGIILDPRAGGNGLLGQSGSICPVDETQTREDNATDLGRSDFRWKDLYLGGGVFLGGTGSANKLDDYEEGLHTASITDSGGTATITMNSSFNQLSYTKIGRLVHVQGTLLVASISATISGTVRISLPFTASSLADQAGKGRIGIGTHNVNFTSSGTAPFLHVGENDAFGSIIVTNDNLNTSQAQFGDTSAQFFIGGTYITDS